MIKAFSFHKAEAAFSSEFCKSRMLGGGGGGGNADAFSFNICSTIIMLSCRESSRSSSSSVRHCVCYTRPE